MSEVGFTKGPWRRGFKNIGHVTAENGAVIAKCQRLTSLCNLQANAHLIAAAPELYGTLNIILDLADNGLDIGSESIMISMVRATLAKARGETP